jgi:hypothetical protein
MFIVKLGLESCGMQRNKYGKEKFKVQKNVKTIKKM